MTDLAGTATEYQLLNRQIETLYRVSSFVGSIYDLEELLSLVMDEAERAVEAEASSVALYDASDDSLNIVFASGEKKIELRNLKLTTNLGIIGAVARSRNTLMINDVRLDPRFDSSVDERTGFTTQSIIAVAMYRRDELIGIVEVINKREGSHFTEEDVRILEVVAEQAAIAIENALMFKNRLEDDRLQTVGKMAASIIHDMRSPMTAIRGYAQMLGRPGVDQDRTDAWSKMIIEAVDKSSNLIQDILDFSKGTLNLERRPVNLGNWISELVLFMAEPLRQKGIALKTELRYRDSVDIDPDRLRRVLVNLIDNASDAVKSGGNIQIVSRLQGGTVEIDISDDGPGIAPENRSKIFEPFSSFGKEHGTGLGLAIAKEIVHEHKGTVDVESCVAGENGHEASGTKFMIRIPLVESDEFEHAPDVLAGEG